MKSLHSFANAACARASVNDESERNHDRSEYMYTRYIVSMEY